MEDTYTIRAEASRKLIAALRILVDVFLDQFLAFGELHIRFGEAVIVHESTAALRLAICAVAEDGAFICTGDLDFDRFAQAG